MKLTNLNIIPFMVTAFILLALNGCGKTGTSSDTGIINSSYDTNTSVLIGDGSTSLSNTSRNVAIDSSGNIYVAYHGTTGIYVTMSKDSGTTFSTPIQVSTTNAQVSIAVSNVGTVYVSWIEAGNIVLSRSLDGGLTYTIPSDIGASFNSSSSVHMATDGLNIYIIPQSGSQLFYSNDNGENFSVSSTSSGAFTDIRVDKNNHYVYVGVDTPTLSYSVSTDFGETFSSPITPGGSIYYSTYAISSGINGRYLFTSGGPLMGPSTAAYRIDLDTNTSTLLVFGQNTTSQGRSLSADSFGNVVDGYSSNDINGSSVSFAVSHNLGDTFSDAIRVDDNSTNISVGIDPLNNKVVVAYEKDTQVYVKTYAGMLLQ